jgi:hypothetical protein
MLSAWSRIGEVTYPGPLDHPPPRLVNPEPDPDLPVRRNRAVRGLMGTRQYHAVLPPGPLPSHVAAWEFSVRDRSRRALSTFVADGRTLST